MSILDTSIGPASLVRCYPIPAPAFDSRFTFGLILDVAKTLEDHGYAPLTSMDLVNLGQALFGLLYAAPEQDGGAA